MRSLWKTICLVASLTFIVTLSSQAQCDVSTIQSITYDTSIVSTENIPMVISLSKFDPTIGTLQSVVINSKILLNYGFYLQNVLSSNVNFTVGVGRYDQITSTALLSTVSNTISDTTVGNYPLAPSQSVSQPLSTILNNFSVINDSITTTVANFMGFGNVVFNYTPITYTNIGGSPTYNFSASANDVTNFSITYYYCTGSTPLATNLLSFTAVQQNSQLINLNWSVSNQQMGSNYEIQSSTDSINFKPIATLSAIANQTDYSYNYNIPSNPPNKIYFRLKLIDPSGAVKYSDIKTVFILNGIMGGYISLFPNPCDGFINIALGNADNSSWDSWIYTSTGVLVQTNHFSNTTQAHIDFNNRLANGAYFIKLINTQTNNQYLLSFIVR